MANKWTKEQQAVIDSRNCNLLVSAAAGSGKTAVLIERIIQLILDEKRPINIDRLLVVTFTRAAAAEMKERVAVAIEEALNKKPDDTHLQKQMMLLNKAEITTIDSFCGNVVRSNFHATDLDPNVRIGDPTEMSIIASEVMNDMFEELYAEENKDFLRLVEWYSRKNDDESLSSLLMSIYYFTCSSPYPLEWLKNSAEFFNNEGKSDEFYIENYVKFNLGNMLMYLEHVDNNVSEILEELQGFSDLEKYYSNFRLFFSSVKMLADKTKIFIDSSNRENLNAVNEAIEDIKNIPKNSFRISKKADPIAKSYYDEIKDLLKKYRDELSGIFIEYSMDIDSIKDECEHLYPYMRAVSNMVTLFISKFADKKKKMGVLEFSDIEHYALDILTDMDEYGNIIPSKIALSYRERYEEVFTDEYQDSNMVQEVILSQVSRKDVPNRFMVGDVKQSIYRFRQAMPEIFMKKYIDYVELDSDNLSGNINSSNNVGDVITDRKIMLYKNFRSRAEVLQGCNHIFSNIMNNETGELDYTVEESLNPSAFFEEIDVKNAHIGGPIEIYLVDRNNLDSEDYKENSKKDFGETTHENNSEYNKVKGSHYNAENEVFSQEEDEEENPIELGNFEFECANIANIIYKMVHSEELLSDSEDCHSRFMVYDKNLKRYRPVEYRDIVILHRAPKKKAATMEKLLLDLNIPVYSEAEGGYFSTLEVSTMLNLLKIIDNPYRDIELISVMKSPIFDFTPSELADIRLFNKKGGYYEAVRGIYDLSIVSEEMKEDCNVDKLKLKNDDKKRFDKLELLDEKLCRKVVDFIDKIDSYRKKSMLISVDEFIWYLLDDTNYYNYVGMLPAGQQRQANLMLLFERARQYENTSYKGLFNFINYFERIKRKSGDLGEAKSISDEANVVRIMSIHKSKGLEFPVVILSNVESEFSSMDDRKEIYLHQKYGYGPRVYNLDLNYIYDSYSRNRIKIIQKKEQIAEEMRLLYVAMTRAKEKLIITAGVKDYEKSKEAWMKNKLSISGEIDSYGVLTKKSYLEWIMPVILGMEERETFYTVTGSEKKYFGYGDCRWSIDVAKKDDIMREKFAMESHLASKNYLEDTHYDTLLEEIDASPEGEISSYDRTVEKSNFKGSICERLEAKINFKYAYENSANKPSSMSVSEVKKIMMEDEEMHKNIFDKKFKGDLRIPDFMHEGENAVEFTPSEKGTIFHTVMQLLDFKKFDLENFDKDKIEVEIERQLENFVHSEILSKEEKETVDISAISRFFSEDIFAKMQTADLDNRLFKEKAIDYSISIGEIYKNEDIDASEKMMLVGIIDLFFEDENGDIVLLDYKTDKVNTYNRDEVVSRYSVQLELYKKALEKISGKSVVKKLIYLFSSGELVEYD